jgi:hypothetical protein
MNHPDWIAPGRGSLRRKGKTPSHPDLFLLRPPLLRHIRDDALNGYEILIHIIYRNPFVMKPNPKRVLQFSEWLTEEVLQHVQHKQYVFTLPKILRHYFKYDRSLLGKLCLCPWCLLSPALDRYKACSKKWAELTKLVYEVDPLQCPKCLHEMRIVAIINDPLVVEKILKHLDLWRYQAHSPPVSNETKIVEEALYDYTFFDYLPA